MIPSWLATLIAVALFVAPGFILVLPRKDRGPDPYDWSSEDDS